MLGPRSTRHAYVCTGSGKDQSVCRQRFAYTSPPPLRASRMEMEFFDPSPSVPAPAGYASRCIPASDRAARPSPSPTRRRREILSGEEGK